MTLTEFRTRFPKYNNISDDQLYAAVNKTHPGLLDSIPSSFAGGYEESDTGLLVPTPEPSPLPPRKPDRMQEFLAPIKRVPSAIKETRGEAINALFDGFGTARQYDPEEALVSGVNKMLAAGMLIPGVSEAFGASNALVGEPAANIMQQTGASGAVSKGLGKLGVERSPEDISSAVQNALAMTGGMAAMAPFHSVPRMVKKAPGLVAGQEAAAASRSLNAPISMTMTQRANLMLPELARNERGSLNAPHPPPFFSQLSKTVTDKKLSGPGPFIAGQIEGMAKKGEFKMEELEWTGLLDELRKDPRKKWTNEELKKFIDDHNVDIVEVTKSDKLLSYDEALDAIEAKKNVWHSEDRGYHEPLSLDDMYKYGPEDKFVVGGEGTKYGDYALPGGENYRELLLTMPNKNDYTIHKHPVGYGFMLSDGEGNLIKGGDGKTMWFQTEAEARSYSPDKPTFKSSHYEEPNILAHIRFNDRTDVDGKKVLFVEEVQSDWHQAGRQKGYKSNQKVTYEIEKQGGDTHPDRGSYAVTYYDDQGVRLGWDGGYRTEESARIAAEERKGLRAKGVPDAPFKKTWPMLAFKRMVRYAAENGYDRIAWTTGEQQAARYDLSKQISKVEYEPTSEKMGDLIGYDHSGRKVLDQEDVSYDKLADYIGKDAAGKLIEKADEYRSIGASEELGWSIEKDPDTGKYHIIDPNGDYLYSYGGDLAEFATDAEARADLRWLHDTERSRTPTPLVSGLDLKIGGEGMSGFYDKILPSEINSFFGKEKWGKAKVGQTKISTQDTSRLPSNDEIGNILKSKDSSLYSDLCEYLEVAEGIDRNKATVGDVGSLYREILRELPDKKFGSELTDKVLKHWENDLFGSDTPVHSLDITPQMRQKALTEGMPLFKRADPFDAFEKQLEQKYQPIMELDQPKTNYPLYDRIDSGEVVPGEIERFLAGFKGKSRDLRAKEIRSVIADRVGDMVSTYRYESFEEGRILEDFIDGLLSETGWVPKDGVPSKSGASFKTSSKQPSARVSKAAGVAPEAAQAALEAISRDWLNAPDIQLLPFDQWPTEFKQGAIGTEQGVIIGDKVLIDPARVSSASELHNVIFHESVGHWGLQKVLGDRFEPFLEDISRGLPDSALKDYGFDLSTREGRLQAVREYAADSAMTGKNPGLISRAAFALRNILRDLGFNIKLSENDVRGILSRYLKQAKSYMEGSAPAVVIPDKTTALGKIFGIMDNAPLYSRMKTPELFRFLNHIQQEKTSPSIIKEWDDIYSKAKKLDKSDILDPKKGGKLDEIAAVHLTRNCQRLNFLRMFKDRDLIPRDFPDSSCYEWGCYKDRTPYSKKAMTQGELARLETSIAEKRIALATPKAIEKLLADKSKVAQLNASKLIRLGQAGDDSHAIVNGLALEWLKQSKEAGIKPQSVFITSAYGPTTPEMYEAMAPYRDRFVLHVTESGWFSEQEIMNRLNEFIKAWNAGLNVKMRVITNKDMVSFAEHKTEIPRSGPMKTPNEPFLFRLIDDFKLSEVVLETPYHNDFLHMRSDPTGKFKMVCCETGKCKTCGPSCLTRQAPKNQKPISLEGK